MNTASANLNPVNPVQTQPAAGKQGDAAAADTPFSQVLSNEIEQHQRSNESRVNAADAKSDVKAKSETKADVPPKTEAKAKADVKAKAEVKAKTDAQAAAELDDATKPDTTDIAALATAGVPSDPLDALQSDAPQDATQQPSAVDSLPTMPDAMLALALHPDLLKPAPAAAGSPVTDEVAALGTDGSSRLDGNLLDARKDSARSTWAAGQQAQEAAGTAKLASQAADPAAPQTLGTATPAADKAAAAAAFTGQLAAARQSEDLKVGERVSELMSNPALQTAPRALPDAAVALGNVASSHLAPSVGSTVWSQAVGEKIVWMAAGAQQTASLTLNPPNMGPLQIVLNVTNDQATASFFSAQPEVRQALEAAFPKLREMMSDAGIQLGQATVSADTPRQNDTPERQPQRLAMPFAGTNDASHPGLQPIPVPLRQSGRGLVDTFA